MKLATFIYKFTIDELNPINDEFYKKFEDLKKTCEQYTEGVRGGGGDYCWNRYCCFKEWHYISVPHSKNYKKIDTSMNKVEEFIKNETIYLINEFNNNISIYLNGYVGEIQSLFDNFNNYTNIKLNSTDELNELTTQYNLILDNMNEIANKDFELQKEKVGNILNSINDKTNDIEKEFFENYYLQNFSSYLEYPDEVLYKVINLEKELKSSSEIVQKQINYIVNKKITRAKKENYIYINKVNDFYTKLLELKINNQKIFEIYKEYRIKEVLVKIKNQNNYSYIYTNDYLDDDFYIDKINSNIKKYKEIISKIEERIKKDWIFKNCTEIEVDNTDYSLSDNEHNYFLLSDSSDDIKLICYEYKNKSSLNYSEYNFNVVKIRTGIYYIKYLYENLENLLNQFNIDILMNISLIVQKDELINDKNILILYEKSKEKLNECNNESNSLLEEYNEYYEEDMKNIFINELDFTKNYIKFENILKFNEPNFISLVNKQINNTTIESLKLIDKFNNSLRKQINLAKTFEKFNFNYTEFNELIKGFLMKIENNFNKIENNIKNISDDYIFNNALRTKIESIYKDKSDYFKNIVEKLSSSYEMKQPFNLTFDMNEITEKTLRKILGDTIFKFIYNYMDAYELNKNDYINSILNLIEIKKEEIFNKYKKVNQDFLNELKISSTDYINKEYLIEYTNNYTLCLNYSFDKLNETLIKDEENYNKYIIYNNRLETCHNSNENGFNIYSIDTIKLNITNSSIIVLIDKLNEDMLDTFTDYPTDFNETDIAEQRANELAIINEYLNNLCEETYKNKVNFTNETEILLDCYNNNYYINYLNLTYFDSIKQEIQINLSELLLENTEVINSYYIGGEFVEKYLLSNDYIKLEEYQNFSTKELKMNIENFNDMTEYINYKMEKKFIEFLKNELIDSFNASYREFITNSISGDVEVNLLIYVLKKIDINIEFIREKILSETQYYILLLNKAEELGITSKNALTNLYDYIYDKVNKTIQYQIEDYIQDNINFIYRENKYIFKDIFINYYLKNASEKFSTDNIFNLNSLLKELIYDNKFNKTLENLNKEIWEELLIDNLNNLIKEKLNSSLENLSEILRQKRKEIVEELNETKTAKIYESMLLLSEMIDNYTALVNEQNNRFKFIVSNSPLEMFGIFSKDYLEPPLNEIKNYYDIIQNELLNKINEIVSNMKDFYAEIQIKYNITVQVDELYKILKTTYDDLIDYSQDLIDDINDYDEILALYTYIDSSTNELRQLNDYLRGYKRNLKESKNIFNLTKDKEMLNKIKRLAEKKRRIKNNAKKNQIVPIFNENNYIGQKDNYDKKSNNVNYRNRKNYNSNKRNTNSKDFNSHSKMKRKLSIHQDQGTITNSVIRKENKKLMKTMKNFNKTYISGDYSKILKNWAKEETKITKYLINAERSLELSVFKFASIITEDKLDLLKDIVYFKYNQISSHVNEYMNLTNIQKDNYLNLLNSSSEMLENTFEEVNEITIFNFLEIKEFITGQIKEISGSGNYEELDGNERLNEIFTKGDIYQPITIKMPTETNNKNNKKNEINLKKSKTINQYYKLLKYSKYYIFNDTEKKFIKLNNILEDSKKYLSNKRRMAETPPNGKDDSNKEKNDKDDNEEDDDDDGDEDIDYGLDILKGQLSFSYSYDKDLFEKKLFDDITIPILPPLCLVIQSKVKLGFHIGFSFSTKLYDDIFETDMIKMKLSENEDYGKDKNDDGFVVNYNVTSDEDDDDDDDDEDDDDDDDTKLSLQVSGKGEISLSAGAGISIGAGPFTFSILAGIKGLLGSGEIGCVVTINLSKVEIEIDKYYIIKAFQISFFLKLEIEINIIFYKLSIEIPIFDIPLFGILIKKHDIKTIKLLANMLEKFLTYSKNQLK